jgi:uncharacterized repeat protein (TIGR01451 family)
MKKYLLLVLSLFSFILSQAQDNPILLDCLSTPLNTVFCYEDGVIEDYFFISENGSVLGMTIHSGNVDSNDLLEVYTSDGVTSSTYGFDANSTTYFYVSSNNSIGLRVIPDNSISCQNNTSGSSISPINFTIYCQPETNTVSGNVTYDSNNNGCDENDFQVNNQIINVNNGIQNFIQNINTNGNYSIDLEQGNYTLNILNLDSNYTSTPPTQTINFSGQEEILENIDFCITANQQFEDLSVDIFPLEDAIPGFETDYQLVVSNNGTQTVPNVQVTFGYDESFQTYVSSTVPTSSIATNLLTFQFTNLEPFSQEVFEITLESVVPPALNGGEVLTFTAQVTPDANDTTPDDNTTIYDQTVVNSFDPNDKMVVQGDEIEIDHTDQYLDYRIRFQNLGTANALNVKITDTIDNNLDWTTFQPITSSHDYRIEIVDGEQINYYFDNINLPFETADPEGSNGYITYKIKPKPTVQIGDTFENTAYIYFDFNLPIITNTVVTTVMDNLDAESFDFNRIEIYPNPVSDQLNIELPSGLRLNSIELFDIQGKPIKIFDNQSKLDLSAIKKGIYILKLETDQGSYHHKIIKE